MADYKRLVSYIYAYPGGVRDKNVGFAKAEVRNGQFKLTVSVKGVYTDTPELFGVYVMVDVQNHQVRAVCGEGRPCRGAVCGSAYAFVACRAQVVRD
mgnify:CR=1 FL=1